MTAAVGPRCRCSHSAWRHVGEVGRCQSRACGCREMRRQPAPDPTPAEQARIDKFEKLPDAPESWPMSRCGVSDCDQRGTTRVDMPESWYLMCPAHAAEAVTW